MSEEDISNLYKFQRYAGEVFNVLNRVRLDFLVITDWGGWALHPIFVLKS